MLLVKKNEYKYMVLYINVVMDKKKVLSFIALVVIVISSLPKKEKKTDIQVSPNNNEQ